MSMPNGHAPETSAPFQNVQVPVTELTDREIAVETLEWLRQFGQLMATFQQMGPAAILKAAMGGKR